MVQTLTIGTFTNCGTFPKAVKLAKDIYGTGSAGKSNRKGPVAHKEIPVPIYMHRDQTLYGDIFFWRGKPFLFFFSLRSRSIW